MHSFLIGFQLKRREGIFTMESAKAIEHLQVAYSHAYTVCTTRALSAWQVHVKVEFNLYICV